jgi:uncharacterized membrane protein YtjA (UPF0391 family)
MMSRFRWSLILLVATLTTVLLGFGGLAGRAGMIVAFSKVASIGCVLMLLVSLFAGEMPIPPKKKRALRDHRLGNHEPRSG